MNERYNPVSVHIVNRLKEIVGDDSVIYGEPEKMESYAYDEATRSDKAWQRMPEVVVMVHSAGEVSRILKLANEEKIPVTPRGAGSGLSGGAVPIYGGILMCMEKMNRILEIDTENLMAVVEPGVVTNELNLEAQKEKLFFAGYPMSFESCFIGGNVAHNAGGGRAVKYGVTSHHILGLEVVLPTGEIVNYGGKRVKDVTGYNMVQLMLGAEGTLGVITRVIVKLIPLPEARAVMLVMFRDLKSALAVVPAIIGKMRIIPSAIEFMDKICIDVTLNYLGRKQLHEDAGALLLFELDGEDQDLVRNKALQIGEYCMEQGALDAFVAETPREQDEFWRIRIACPEALQSLGGGGDGSGGALIEDIVVPLANIMPLLECVHALGAKYKAIPICLGHAGDGNVHISIAKYPDVSPEEWKSVVPELLSELYTRTNELGGTISGEHGIAHKRKRYMNLVMGQDEINSMKKIKLALDPNVILNPGKKFDVG